MDFEIHISGKVPEVVVMFLEKTRDFVLDTLVLLGVEPAQVTGGVTFPKETEK